MFAGEKKLEKTWSKCENSLAATHLFNGLVVVIVVAENVCLARMQQRVRDEDAIERWNKKRKSSETIRPKSPEEGSKVLGTEWL